MGPITPDLLRQAQAALGFAALLASVAFGSVRYLLSTLASRRR